MVRRILWASLALAPLTMLADLALHPGRTLLFALSAISLVPLAWLIGEATEHAAEHTGPGIGGFLNASFGNAPELIIALLAVQSGLPNVVRGSIAGSVISNILLVLGAAFFFAPERGKLDRVSLLRQLGLVALAVAAFLVPSIPGWHGNPERHALVVLTIPVAIVLLLVYLAYTAWGLRRHHRMHEPGEDASGAWSLRSSLAALAAATVVTAVVSEILVHSLDAFAKAAGLTEFFVAAVIVALVGNAAEHGGAIVIAKRGKVDLATEIAITSSAQVGLLVAPVVALASLAFAHSLPLAFRWEELAAMGLAAIVVAVVVADGRSRRWEGIALGVAYAGVAVWFGLAGNR